MNLARTALCSAFLAASLVAVISWGGPASAQTPTREGATQAVPKAADGNYAGTDIEGNYQRALDAAIARAQSALTNNGQLADARINWTVYSVSGTMGGIMGAAAGGGVHAGWG